jgi:Leucine-rich repeat (LRR) protein
MSRKKLIGIIGACFILVIVVLVIATRPTPTYNLSVTISPLGAGSVSPSGGEYESAVQVTLTATPASGYRFVNWTSDVGTIANVNAASTTIIMNDNYSINASFEEEEAVTYPDPNLEVAVREAINKPTGPIYPSDLVGLTLFYAPSRNIINLTGLEHFINVRSLNLGSNQISDISPLANLTSLTFLNLSHNEIRDISPLVQNEGLGTGDEVYLDGNPLSSNSTNIYIPQLQARGVIGLLGLSELRQFG